ncbi:MAG: YjbF family lipoprotein [Paracoccaceae bacterium]
MTGLFQFGPKAKPPGPDDLLTRDVIDTVTVPYAMVGIERREAYATMTLAGQNGPYDSWVTADGAGIVLRNDVLTGTKGLGADLVTADPGEISAVLRSGQSGAVSRTHEYTDGEGRIFTNTYACTLSPAGSEAITIIGGTYQTRVMSEICTSNQEEFENRYWIGKSDGIMWKSRQWVSADVGHVLLLTLVTVAR